MYPLYFFIAALICYGVLIAVIIYTIGIYRKANELNPHNRKLEQLLADIRVASATKDQIDAEISELLNQKGYYQGIIADGKAAEDYLQKHGVDVKNARDFIDKLNRDTEEANKVLDGVKKQIDEANAERNKVQEEEREAQQNATLAQSKYNLLLSKSTELDGTVKSLESQINELSPKKATLQTQVDDLNRRIAEAQKELDEIKEKARKESERKAMELVSKEQDIATAKGQLTAIKKEIESDEVRLKGLQTNIDSIKGVEAWAELDTPIIENDSFSKPNNKAPKTINEIDGLNQFAVKLDECNIKFTRRTINAFHTSLKVADSSPLVVLAGISGTGKSLLPQLYAEYFGFNFLNMAVQPRWDSSQDLFGFYNYAQFSYKATDLSRLLWQYDVYNNDKCSFSKYKQLRPMNIVLLDEMNLARVEYYFSDMLSKLETRKAINPNGESRKYAEVELECGASAPRRLFIDRNTLFVGTMNEDETTQALSDKIMDRANVLRFGRPKTLKATGNPQVFGENAREVPMTVEAWNSIYKTHLDTTLDNKIDDEIEQINDTMEELGRPFGHRVKRAIVDYVTNYPNVSDKDEFNNAIADQIEFKILPKLNGLDMSNPNVHASLEELGKFCEGDNELSQAFRKVMDDNTAPFFAWTGVKR